MIELLLDGQALKIVKQDQQWIAETPVEGIAAELITAIAKNITLRFRI